MKLAEEKNIIVEVREWINKTSGRGDFIIITIDNTGVTKELFGNTVMGFVCRPYDEVLPEIFPWADLVLDKDYYESQGDQEYILYKKCESPDIYPYRNTAGEVDWYQFRLVLNEVGKAFLTMDDFLSDGRMYNIRF